MSLAAGNKPRPEKRVVAVQKRTAAAARKATARPLATTSGFVSVVPTAVVNAAVEMGRSPPRHCAPVSVGQSHPAGDRVAPGRQQDLPGSTVNVS